MITRETGEEVITIVHKRDEEFFVLGSCSGDGEKWRLERHHRNRMYKTW